MNSSALSGTFKTLVADKVISVTPPFPDRATVYLCGSGSAGSQGVTEVRAVNGAADTVVNGAVSTVNTNVANHPFEMLVPAGCTIEMENSSVDVFCAWALIRTLP